MAEKAPLPILNSALNSAPLNLVESGDPVPVSSSLVAAGIIPEETPHLHTALRLNATDNGEEGEVQEEQVNQPEAPNPALPLIVDLVPDDNSNNEDFRDDDSAFHSGRSSNDTTSLASSIKDYQYENGRRYHAYRRGEYLLPNDEIEQDRLDLEHHVFRLTLGGALFRAPINAHPHRVLDMGTGTGIWAIDCADMFPSAEVIGTDLSPIQPAFVPPNCRFIIDDLEAEWVWSPSEAFDYIHGKTLGGSIKDWPRLYAQAFAHLKPGGWVEMQEFEGVVASDDDPELKNAPFLDKWQRLVDEAMTKIGKKLDVAHEQKQHLIDAGFVDVHDDVYKVPSGRWPRDPKLKELGMYQLEHLIDCVEPYTLGCFTRILHWSVEEAQVLMAKVKQDMRNKQNHFHAKFHFVYGRKPF